MRVHPSGRHTTRPPARHRNAVPEQGYKPCSPAGAVSSRDLPSRSSSDGGQVRSQTAIHLCCSVWSQLDSAEPSCSSSALLGACQFVLEPLPPRSGNSGS